MTVQNFTEILVFRRRKKRENIFIGLEFSRFGKIYVGKDEKEKEMSKDSFNFLLLLI